MTALPRVTIESVRLVATLTVGETVRAIWTSDGRTYSGSSSVAGPRTASNLEIAIDKALKELTVEINTHLHTIEKYLLMDGKDA